MNLHERAIHFTRWHNAKLRRKPPLSPWLDYRDRYEEQLREYNSRKGSPVCGEKVGRYLHNVH